MGGNNAAPLLVDKCRVVLGQTVFSGTIEVRRMRVQALPTAFPPLSSRPPCIDGQGNHGFSSVLIPG